MPGDARQMNGDDDVQAKRDAGGDECSAALSRLRFRGSGVVGSEMTFRRFDRPCHYAETDERWSTPWDEVDAYPYLFQVEPPTGDATDGAAVERDPPLGMRSAVPLGGLGAGTVELRADGSLRDWNIFNNSPGGGGQKVQLEEAFFGLRVQPEGESGRAWTVRTHPPCGLPAIRQLEYSGAFPAARLRLSDPGLPVAVDLYAYCEFHLRDPEASAAPAAVFSVDLRNASNRSVAVALMFSLPNHIGGRFEADAGLRLVREGTDDASGTMAVRVAGDRPTSTGSGASPADVWNSFAAAGTLAGLSEQQDHGALATTLTLGPGESKTATFVLCWHFPHRRLGEERVGNFYTNLHTNAGEAARQVASRLPATWAAVGEWHDLCFENTLPGWLQEALVNSAATMAKTGMWYEDGRWRQWESFSCPAVDLIHIHLYRCLPYALFFPGLRRNLLEGYAEAQEPGGYVREDLSGSPRQMGDGCPAFVLSVYQHVLWTGDDGARDLWPAARRALLWQIERCKEHGLPNRLGNTYDWWGFESKDVVAYNAVLHLAAMLAGERLARLEGDAETADACRANYESARAALDEMLWTGRYFRSWWMADGSHPDALHADALYGQLWAFLLGLGPIADLDKMRSHLACEMRMNGSPFGLLVTQGAGRDRDRYPEPMPKTRPGEEGPRDYLVWQAGSLNWCALSLYLGGDVSASLAEAEKVVGHWQRTLCDPWDYRDLTTGWDGYPWCNSHYARQLILWTIPLALSGQQYSAPEKRLGFDPRLPAPARLPWFTPTANGALEILDGGRCRLTVMSGGLALNELRVGEASLGRAVSLTAGESAAIG